MFFFLVRVCVSDEFHYKRKWQRSHCKRRRRQPTAASSVWTHFTFDENESHFFSEPQRHTDKRRNIGRNRNRSQNVKINSITSEWWRIWCDSFVLRSPFPVPPRRRSFSIFSPDSWPLSPTISLRSTTLRFPSSKRATASQPAAWTATSYRIDEWKQKFSSPNPGKLFSFFFYRFFSFAQFNFASCRRRRPIEMRTHRKKKNNRSLIRLFCFE